MGRSEDSDLYSQMLFHYFVILANTVSLTRQKSKVDGPIYEHKRQFAFGIILFGVPVKISQV